MKTVAEESDFPLEELARQLLYLNGSFSADFSAMPPPEQLKSPKIEIESELCDDILIFSLSDQNNGSSPGTQLSDTEFKEKNLKEQKRCKCKMSRCLKLYCQCFATGTYCNGCSCSNCQNNIENETARHAAAAYILEHYPKVFWPKIVASPNKGEARCSLIMEKFEKGCHCKRSECLKGYCKCYRANILCSEICKCFDCKNCQSSEERSSLESKKRKTPVNLPSSNRGTPFNCSVQHYKQAQICTPSLSFSKFKHRSMIADIDLMDVCLILLGASASVNILSGKGSPINIEVSPGPIVLTGDKKEDRDCNTDTYIEKEKLVLVKFRDFLDRIIALGNIKDKWSTSHGSGNSKV